MVRDVVRAVLVCVVMAVGAALIIEVRYQLAAVDAAHRMIIVQPHAVASGQPEGRPLGRLGRSILELADSTISLVR